MNRNDNTLDFFDKYLSKYALEITDFKNDVRLNEEDTNLFLHALEVTLGQGFNECREEEMISAIELYDNIVFYVSCGLLYFDYDKKEVIKLLLSPNSKCE